MDKNEVLEKIRSKITPGQEWMVDNIQYLTLTGSHAYGINNEDSDFDVYGFTIPPIEYVYADNLLGFEGPPTFNQFEGKVTGKTKNECLDFTIYNITRYFKLVMENNPNMIDSLFTGKNCELVVTDIARKVKDNRKLFLHKGSWPKFKGYSFSQLNKIRVKPEDRENPDRKLAIEKYGYDTQFAVHIFRLLDEVEQILTLGDIDLTRNREQLKRVKEGYYKLEEIDKYFKEKELMLEKAYNESTLPWGPREKEIRELLVTCLEDFYENP